MNDIMLITWLVLSDFGLMKITELGRKLRPIDRKRIVYWTSVGWIVDTFGRTAVFVWILLHIVIIRRLIG